MLGDTTSTIPASWSEPNYEDPVTRSWLPIFAITIHVFTSLLVAIRIGLRFNRQAGGFGLDDAFLVPAWLLATAFVALASYASYEGFIDRHVWDLRPDKNWENRLNGWISMQIFIIGTCVLKVSVLLFSRRIVASTFRKVWRYAVWGAIGFTVAYSVALVLMLTFTCSSTEAYWRAFDINWHKDFQCHDTKAGRIAGVLSIVSDVYSIVLPCLMCRKLALPWRQKLALNLVFSAGICVIVAAAMRTWALSLLITRDDVTWIGFWVFFWSILEYDLGLICTCIPSLRYLIKRHLRDTTRDQSAPMQKSSAYSVRCVGDHFDMSAAERQGHSSPIRKPLGSSWSRLHDDRSPIALTALPAMDTSPVSSPKEFEEFSLHMLQTGRDSWRMGVRNQKKSPRLYRST